MESWELQELLLAILGAIQECATSLRKMDSPDAVDFFVQIILNRVRKARALIKEQWTQARLAH